MSCDYSIPTLLLRFLGSCVYGDARALYAALNAAELDELETQGEKFGMTAWFYRYLHDVLPDGKRAEYRKTYQARQLKAMADAQELKRLYRMLAGHGLRFVTIKGADLAYRLYPDPALRLYSDWDIWFHPDDCERALVVLGEDGWTIPEFYSRNHEFLRKIGVHHYSPHVRRHHTIEPHFTMSNFNDIDPREMWEQTAEYPAGDGQRILSPEMNLLMLARHAASQSYYHARIPKLLTDAAMVLRDPVDFAVLRGLSDRWHLPYPGDLLAAFPEFFPAEIIDKFGACPEKAEKFRTLFTLRASLGEQDKMSVDLKRYEIRGQLAGKIWKLILAHTPAKMRLIYHLPELGAWGRVAWSYIHWIWTRTLSAKAWIRRDPGLRDYASIVESLESNAPPDK